MHSIAFFIRPLCSLRSRKRFNGADADTVLCNRAAATMLLREKETSYVLLGSANALLQARRRHLKAENMAVIDRIDARKMMMIHIVWERCC
jgi:hypothetical protein